MKDIIFIILIFTAICIAVVVSGKERDRQKGDYQLVIQDQWTIVMYDRERVIHVFNNSDSASKALFDVILKDNE